MPSITNLRRIARRNVQVLRSSPLSELSGAFGDLSTLLPLLVAMTLSHSISLPASLLFMGASNVLTGFLFGIPLPVQPMKAIASIAIARNFTLEETAAAGIGVSAVVGILSVTGLLHKAAIVVPIPVVKGIQVGAGLSLVLSAGEKMLTPLGWTRPSPFDNLLWATGATLALLVCTRAARVPYALVVFILGLGLAAVQLRASDFTAAAVPRLPIVVPSRATFARAFVTAALGQLPLTILNSIIAVTHLSADLLPDVPTPSVTAIGASVALMNLVGCWFGAMPACHGSGGLAAQHRFGARSGTSVVLLGALKVGLGLAAGERLVPLLTRFPRALLGVMVLAAGVELARAGESLNVGARDLWEEGEDDAEADTRGVPGKTMRVPDEKERMERWAVMMVTVAGLLAFRNDAVGFVAGMLWHWGLRARFPPTWWRRRRERSERSAAGADGERLLEEQRESR